MIAALHDVLVMTRRNLIHIAREPMQLGDVTFQPVLFTLLFVYVFGSGIPVPGGTYAAFALAGLLLLNLTTSSMGTAVGLTSDLSTGIIDRFRTLPMWSPAVLIGRSLTDLLTAALCTLIVLGTGLVVGWRPESGVGETLGGFGVALLFAYALSWLGGCVGLWAKGVETAQSFGFLVLFPMSFVSNALVPTRGMPDWLRTIADWNPVSAVTAACRTLWGNPNPSAASGAWSMQHPGVDGGRVVARDPRRVSAPGLRPLPAPHDRLTHPPAGLSASGTAAPNRAARSPDGPQMLATRGSVIATGAPAGGRRRSRRRSSRHDRST